MPQFIWEGGLRPAEKRVLPSSFADPMFVDPKNKDCRVKPESPAQLI